MFLLLNHKAFLTAGMEYPLCDWTTRVSSRHRVIHRDCESERARWALFIDGSSPRLYGTYIYLISFSFHSPLILRSG